MENRFELKGYRLAEKLYESDSSIIFRGTTDDEKRLAVVVKFHKSERPARREIEKLEHEYDLMKSLAIPGMIKVYACENFGNTKAFVMEDFSGVSLDKFLKMRKLALSEFLSIAIDIISALEQVHAARIVHKDIKPHNILIDEKTLKIKLIDFGIAGQLGREYRQSVGIDKLEGTLAYMAPEQTGRINRPIDFRSDYYSLGVTFYEMLTGNPPFTSSDPMEIIHAHLARMPVNPSERNPDVPETISDIILKLLSKNAEDRYRSAAGLKSDLAECLDQLKKNRAIKRFPLGENDVITAFCLPEKIYGREKEVKIFSAEAARIFEANAEPVLIFLSGPPGIGKSYLINEMRRSLIEKKCYFIGGKYEQLQRAAPFSAIIDAFKDLMDQILGESEPAIEVWKKKIVNALGDNASLVTEVIPQLKLIIGDQPPVEQLPPAESENRFAYVFQNFTKVFASAKRPLVFSLDDMQWADNASLKWLQIIFMNTELKNMLFIGSYMDGEITPSNPFSLFLDNIHEKNLKRIDIVLSPLEVPAIAHILADAMRSDPDDTRRLAEVIKHKTEGNPFFINEFMKYLDEERLIRYDQKRWHWDIEKIKQAHTTDNVVEFMAKKILKLPARTRIAMKVASCAGMTFYFDTLGAVLELTEETLIRLLAPVILEGMVLKFENMAKFAHSRVREAVYAMLSPEEKIKYHYQLGRSLLLITPPELLDDRIFSIVQQMNYAIAKIANPKERQDLALLNLRAGMKAKLATAYESASTFFKAGIELLPPDAWNICYDAALSLYTESGVVEYILGNHADAEGFFQAVLKFAKNPLDKINVFSVQIPLNTVKNNMDLAVKQGRMALQLLGMKTPKKGNVLLVLAEVLKAKRLLGKKNVEDLLALPDITDPLKLAISRLLMQLMLPAFISFPDYFPVIALKLVNYSLKHGNSPYSLFAFTVYGLMLCGPLGDIELGYKYGRFARALVEKFNAKTVRCKVDFIFGNMINHWKRPMREDIPLLEEGYVAGFEAGDLSFASYCINHNMAHSIWSGENLEIAIDKGRQYLEIMKKFNQIDAIFAFHMFYQFAHDLSRAQHSFLIKGDLFDEEKMIPDWIEKKNYSDMGFYSICKQFVHYLFGDYKNSLKYAHEMQKYISSLLGMIFVVESNYYHSLACLGDFDSVGMKERTKYLVTVRRNQKQMKKWANHCPENCLHKYLFVEAELSSKSGDIGSTMKIFDDAIDAARKNGFVNEEAIILEHAALFYNACGRERISDAYLKESFLAYYSWGAMGKIAAMQAEHPEIYKSLLEEGKVGPIPATSSDVSESPAPSSTTSKTVMGSLDMSTVMKAATAISGEIVMDRLVGRLIRIVMENAGAEKAVLLLNKDGELVVEAMGAAGSDIIRKYDSLPMRDFSIIPESVVRFVNRTHDNLVLNNACFDGAYTRDEYIIKNKIKSILCAPIVNKNALRGILYLENNLSTGVFTKERLKLISLLAGQIGISIDNASLYEKLEDYSKNLQLKVEERTHELSKAHQELAKRHENMKKELKIARTIQHALIPEKFPDFPSVRLAGRYVPMEELGGDFYDVIYINQHKLALVIVDVSGHGVPAALVTAMAKISFGSNTVDGIACGDIMSRVNLEICGAIEGLHNFLTAFFCILDIEKRELEYCNAGHPEALLIRNEKAIIPLAPTATILGYSKKIEYLSEKIKIRTDDKLILYTDGIPEARNEYTKNFYQMARFKDNILKNSRKEPDQLAERLLADVYDFIGESEIKDDITLLIGEITGTRESAGSGLGRTRRRPQE